MSHSILAEEDPDKRPSTSLIALGPVWRTRFLTAFREWALSDGLGAGLPGAGVPGNLDALPSTAPDTGLLPEMR
jgi:hypothetical protein